MLKLLFYGFRHGHIHALYRKASATSEIEIVGCVEDDPDARRAAEEALGIRCSERSFDEWLTEDIDAVAIGTAYGQRGAAAIKALRAGKHVISDKPVCTDSDELSTIRTLAAERGLTVGCMLDLRDLPQTRAAKRLLSEGTLGEVRNIAFCGQHYLDYPHRPKWYFEAGMHGGTINDLAIHGVDLVRMLTGREITAVDAARVWNAYAVHHKDFCDSALFMARLDNGAGVLADVSYSAPKQAFSMPSYWEFRIWCDKGMLTFSYGDPEVTVYTDNASDGTPVRIPGIAEGRDYLGAFLDAVNTGDDTLTCGVLRSTETALWIQSVADKEVLK